MSQPLTPSPPIPPAPIERHEWVVLLVICLLGIGLRGWRFDRLSIEHFDEGVYAANVYAVMDNNCYPQRHLYAPPLFPLLCEFAIGIGGTPDAAIWINLFFGALMVPLVWVVARDTFGPDAAVVSAVLCATSDYHIFFSRSALTDVSLCFWLLLAVWLAGRGMRSGNGLTLGWAGIAAALAWWTKYNGWLAIAIPLGGWGLLAIVSLMKRSVPVQARLAAIDRAGFFRWVMFAAVAGLLWSPVVYDLQAVGGYAAVAKNHSRYLVGLSGWWDGLRMHMAFHGWLTSFVGVMGPSVAVGLLLWVRRGREWGVVWFFSLLLTASLGMGGVLGMMSLLAVAAIAWGWWEKAATGSRDLSLSEAMLVTWFVGLTLTTPLYTPYARLSLPWLVSCWMLIGGGVVQRIQLRFKPEAVLTGFLGVFCFVMVGTFILSPRTHTQPDASALSHVWGDRTSLRKATAQILHETDMGRRDLPPSETSACDYAIYVVGEPALFCHLTQQSGETIITKPANSVSEAAAPHGPGPAFPKFIVTGSHVPLSEIDEALASKRIELIWEQRVLVSDLVALDSASWPQLQATHSKSIRPPENTIPIRVFRIVD